MTCLYPRLAYRKTNGQITLAKIGDNAPIGQSILVACQQCMQCRISKQRQWSTRMVHEARMHDESCFLTLTISDEHRNEKHSLDVRDVQLFMKRLRKHLQPKKIRVYMAGEYGEDTLREHYHAIIFGYMPEDKENFNKNEHGDMLYTSKTLEKIWGKGFVTIGNFTPTTADYCAKYVTKAYIGKDKANAYNWINEETGEVIQRTPPFQTSSRRPGLGIEFYKKYKGDLYNEDQAIIDGKSRPVPKAYDKYFKAEHPEEFAKIKRQRNDAFTKALNDDPHKKTLSMRKAQKVLLEQGLKIKKRDKQ